MRYPSRASWAASATICLIIALCSHVGAVINSPGAKDKADGVIVINNIMPEPGSSGGADQFNRAMDILEKGISLQSNFIAGLGVGIAIFGIGVAVLGFLGFSELKRYFARIAEDTKRDADKMVSDAGARLDEINHQVEIARQTAEAAKKLAEDACVSREVAKKAEQEANDARDKAVQNSEASQAILAGLKSKTSLPSTPEEAALKKNELEEISKKTDEIEKEGGTLTSDDYCYRGWAFWAEGKNEEALEQFRRATEIGRNNADAWFGLGCMLTDLKRYDEAIIAYDEAIKIKADFHESFNNKGVCLAALKKYAEAIAAYDEAIKIKPDSHEAWYNRAYAYSLKGDKTKALDNLKQAIELHPDNKQKAQTDEDFAFLRDDSDFKALVS